MAHWDSRQGKIIRWPTVPIPDYLGWTWEDCGCSAGFVWGAEFPAECSGCDGNGRLARHAQSGVLAVYPGGPLKGRTTPEQAA